MFEVGWEQHSCSLAFLPWALPYQPQRAHRVHTSLPVTIYMCSPFLKGSKLTVNKGSWGHTLFLFKVISGHPGASQLLWAQLLQNRLETFCHFRLTPCLEYRWFLTWKMYVWSPGWGWVGGWGWVHRELGFQDLWARFDNFVNHFKGDLIHSWPH